MTDAVAIQAKAYAGYGKAARVLGLPCNVFRPDVGGSNPLDGVNCTAQGLRAVFTAGKASNAGAFDRVASYDDLLWTALVDGTQLQPGDFLDGPSGTYFVAAMDPLLPISCVRCSRTVTLQRPNSQLSSGGGSGAGLPSQDGSAGTYWGASSDAAISGPGWTAIVANVPVAITATAGRATGTGELPADSPGPSRWRLYLPVSCFPKGSVRDRDVFVDEEGHRRQVSAAGWTPIGYRIEAVTLEN